MTTSPTAPPPDAPQESWAERLDRQSGRIMVLPAVLVLLCFAIFPLIISAYLSLSRFVLAPGGFTLKFVGILNFKKLLTGSQQYHLLGTFGTPGVLGWAAILVVGAALLLALGRYFRRGWTVMGTIGRLITMTVVFGLTLLAFLAPAQTGTAQAARPTYCPLIYAPVCGWKDGRRQTYPNACTARVAKARNLVLGPCR